MKVYLYSGMQKMIEKSGVGRAIYHQRKAAQQNHMECVDRLEEADVVHINTVFPNSIHVAHKAHRLGIPVVYHAHSTKEDFKNSFVGSNFFDELFGKWIRYCYETGDVIVTPSHYAKKLLQSYGIKKDIVVISNGIDLADYQRTQDYEACMLFRHKYGFSPEDKVIMSAGLQIERKGILDFVELAKQMPEYKFIWFGETDLYTVPKKIRDAVRTKLPNLTFAGYIPKDELKTAYESFDLFLFPSKEETEGIVVLEALAMKIPVLLRDIPVYEDWLVDGQDVYKAENGIEMKYDIKNILEGKMPDLTEDGYQVAVQRNLPIVGSQLQGVYQQAMKECSIPKMAVR